MLSFGQSFQRIVVLICIGGLFSLGAYSQTGEKPGEKAPGLEPKKAGVKRLGVLLPSVILSNAGDKVDPADAVRNTFITLLNSKTIELVPLDAKLNALALKEATEKECDYVLKITLTQRDGKAGGFLNKILDRSADSAITQTTSRVPGGRTVPGSVGREAVIGAGQEVSQIEFSIKKKDEFTLTYEIATPKAKVVAGKTLKAAAQKDNDAVLVPLIEKAANEVAVFLIQ